MKLVWKFVAAATTVWLFAILLFSSNTLYPQPSSSEEIEELTRRLRVALDTLNEVKASNKKLVAGIESRSPELGHQLGLSTFVVDIDSDSDSGHVHSGSSVDHEVYRRSLENGIFEIYFRTLHTLDRLVDKDSSLAAFRKSWLEQHRSLLHDVHAIQNLDRRWHVTASKRMAAVVQNRITRLQDPSECASARKLLCDLTKGCGFGCQIHHVAYCMQVAYALNRTLVLNSRDWRYAQGQSGWERAFLPLSTKCSSRDATNAVRWSANVVHPTAPDLAVALPIIDGLSPNPEYLPQAVPADLYTGILKFHGHPFVWWMGQIMTYLFRPQPPISSAYQTTAAEIGFENPIVGVHVRRTDKVGTEASFHGIDEYMRHVEEYFRRLDTAAIASGTRKPKRRIFLATDDNQLLVQTREKYGDYSVLNIPASAASAQISNRYGADSLRYVLLDVHFLSRSDYLVCTFSSQICRVAYELMQTLHVDASTRFHSLDDIYYFGGQRAHDVTAIYPHTPAPGSSEIELQPGDVIGIAGNHWDGFSKGVNRRTGQNGLFPSYKAKERPIIASMPVYSEFDKLLDSGRHR